MKLEITNLSSADKQYNGLPNGGIVKVGATETFEISMCMLEEKEGPDTLSAIVADTVSGAIKHRFLPSAAKEPGLGRLRTIVMDMPLTAIKAKAGANPFYDFANAGTCLAYFGGHVRVKEAVSGGSLSAATAKFGLDGGTTDYFLEATDITAVSTAPFTATIGQYLAAPKFKVTLALTGDTTANLEEGHLVAEAYVLDRTE